MGIFFVSHITEVSNASHILNGQPDSDAEIEGGAGEAPQS